MKNKQKGFVIPLIISILAILAIGGSVYIYSQNNKSAKLVDDTNLNTGQNVAVSDVSNTKDNTDPIAVPFKEELLAKDQKSTSETTVKAETKTSVNNVEKPDLTIEDIQTYDALATSKKSVGLQYLTAKICNRGKVGINTGNLTKEPEKISISFTINGITTYSSKSIPSILAGSCDPLVGFYLAELSPAYGPFKGIKSGNYNVTAKVDAESKVDESNEDNNSFTKNIYLDFEPTIAKLSVISPTAGAIWKEGGEYTINWQPFGENVVRYYVTIGNYGSATSMGLPVTYSQQGIGTQTSLTYKIEKGFVNGMFFGDANGKVAADIKNDFYIEVTATDSNKNQIGSGRSGTFTILP